LNDSPILILDLRF